MDKRCRPRSRKIKELISKQNIMTWQKKAAVFLSKSPKCIKCGWPFDHYSRTMICMPCRRAAYYLANRAEIRLRRKK